MRITLITVGRLKEKYFREAAGEYSKRLTKYAKLEIVEVPGEPAGENLSAAFEETVRRREGERILKNIKGGSGEYIIAAAVSGAAMDSEGFAAKLAKLPVDGYSHIYFIIGGSLGLSKEVLERAGFYLSFSKMTFPHQLMRVLLLEQVYRAFRINNNEPYHK